ncbi:adenosylcobinamide-GDP ribazoletransferase [Ectopseudomonas mendocina]|uniref:Adenosylcobinamide-GDP ribazoletransferase n=1 Tax=Ectopseudomonas mendocina TaxID=300 RepID=A0ABZ2RLF9_ECTME
MTAWWIALQFLTRLPVTLADMPQPQQVGRSLLFYPLVGLLIGALLYVELLFTATAPTLLQAALVLATWIALTGALHIDGLADSADAWVGGLGDKERTLRIMKDPASGPVAVVTLILLMLVKFSALVAILEAGDVIWLILVPWVARVALPLLFLTTPYTREGGLGTLLTEHMPRKQLRLVLLMHGVAMLLTGLAGLVVLLTAGIVFGYLRLLMLKRLGGCTGDTAGALVEITECIVLVSLALTLG